MSEQPDYGAEQRSEHVAEKGLALGVSCLLGEEECPPSTIGRCSHSLFPRMESRRFALPQCGFEAFSS